MADVSARLAVTVALNQVGSLAGLLITACMKCLHVYRVEDANGGSTGCSHGLCDRCAPADEPDFDGDFGNAA